MVEMEKVIYKIVSVWMQDGQPRFRIVDCRDARKATERERKGMQPSLRELMQRGARKVVVGPLGNVDECND